MKKIFLAMLCLHISVYSFSQVSFGVKAGLNVNDVVVKNSPAGTGGTGAEPAIGFHVGVYGKIRLIEKLSFIPELQFSQRGYAVKDPYEFRINLNYLELPLLLSYSPVERLSIDLGPSVAYKISAVSKSDGTSTNVDGIFEKDLDVGITGGLRFNVTENIGIIGRYYYGVTSVMDIQFRDDFNNPLGTGTMHNSSFQFGLSYKIK